MNEKENCELCDRAMPLTFHHLVPKKMHKRGLVKKKFTNEEMKSTGIFLCRDCHSMVHRTFDHKSLALHFNTREALAEDPQIIRFVEWVKRQSKKVKR